ncbi:helix-turn-helix domain-containing protein [Flavivirga eckloniae]|uniref:Response regulator n=1 Tax=Flavivirga eckloniae TaxID=1803846 RepID=A0A2K9PQ18_9FLAO|nr:response regulator [Flavivirga eckloniae]AUP79136.1 response regulator [Flavivirga eckloniae]
MFKKILLVEDIDTISDGIASKIKQGVGITNITIAQYCDNAYIKFVKAEIDQEPFDLLITDLSFKKDYRESSISSGEQLIKKLRDKNYNIPIVVYSIEERPSVIKKLMERYGVSAYVFKGRNSAKSMIDALKCVKESKRFISEELTATLRKKEIFTLKEFDAILLHQLSKGSTQEEISIILKEKSISPNSLSSIEKRLNRLKEELKAKTTIQLIANAKDLGLI